MPDADWQGNGHEQLVRDSDDARSDRTLPQGAGLIA